MWAEDFCRGIGIGASVVIIVVKRTVLSVQARLLSPPFILLLRHKIILIASLLRAPAPVYCRFVIRFVMKFIIVCHLVTPGVPSGLTRCAIWSHLVCHLVSPVMLTRWQCYALLFVRFKVLRRYRIADTGATLLPMLHKKPSLHQSTEYPVHLSDAPAHHLPEHAPRAEKAPAPVGGIGIYDGKYGKLVPRQPELVPHKSVDGIIFRAHFSPFLPVATTACGLFCLYFIILLRACKYGMVTNLWRKTGENLCRVHKKSAPVRGAEECLGFYLTIALKKAWGAGQYRSIRIRRLYFAHRSERQGAPHFIYPAQVAAARSAMKVSSVSPERWEII